jgi:hypothetical protein
MFRIEMGWIYFIKTELRRFGLPDDAGRVCYMSPKAKKSGEDHE